MVVVLALAVLAPPGRSGAPKASPREEYSASGGAPRLRLPLARPARSIPKDLEELRLFTGGDFLCVRRGDYLVAGDLGPGEYEYLVDGVLDYCSDAMRRVFFDRVRGGRTVNIFVFRDYSSYEKGLRRLLGMDPISPYGHYGHSQKYIVINYETGPGTLVHELAHALMSEDFPEAPIWLAEGLASLYEHCRAEDGALKGDDNWRLPELQAALRENRTLPLERLFSLSPAEFRSGRESLHYAEARYFCKYLEEMGLLSRVYKSFRHQPTLDPGGTKFVIAAFGQPLPEIEAAWRLWTSSRHWRE
jgi:hypothetical protein